MLTSAPVGVGAPYLPAANRPRERVPQIPQREPERSNGVIIRQVFSNPWPRITTSPRQSREERAFGIDPVARTGNRYQAGEKAVDGQREIPLAVVFLYE